MRALLLLLALAAPAPAAVVHVKGGGRIHGAITSRSPAELVIETAEGPRAIPLEQVERIEEGDFPAAPSQLAYSDEGTSELSIDIGVGVPLDDVGFGSVGGGDAANGGVGPAVGFEYLAPASRRLMAGFTFGYFHRGRNDSGSGVPLAVTDVGGDTLLLMGMAKYVLKPGPVAPYVRVGLGAHRTTTEVDVTPLLGFVWADTQTAETRTFVDDEAWGLATTARFGVEFDLTDPTFFAFEFGWLGLHNARYEPTPLGASSGISGGKPFLDNVVVAGRWGWKF